MQKWYAVHYAGPHPDGTQDKWIIMPEKDLDAAIKKDIRIIQWYELVNAAQYIKE